MSGNAAEMRKVLKVRNKYLGCGYNSSPTPWEGDEGEGGDEEE